MKFLQGLSQKFPVKMRIDLGGADAFMPQHFLHRPQVCAAFHQMGGKGMPEGVRRHCFFYPGFSCQVFYDVKDHDPR